MPPAVPVPASSGRPKVLLLGDSLTQTSFEGWGARLADRYQRRADVVNRGMSGYNTRWYLRYADGPGGVWEEGGSSRGGVEHPVVLVLIFFGANDAALADQDPAKHVPTAEYRENLVALVGRTRDAYPGAAVLLLTPPPVHEGQRLEFQKIRYGEKATGIPERTSDHTRRYVAACLDVAREMGVPCLDVFDAMMTEGGGEDGPSSFGRFLSDGLHFSKEGHDLVFDRLVAAIEAHFPGLAVRPDPGTGQPNNSGSRCVDLRSSGPYHDEIDSKEWERAFEKE